MKQYIIPINISVSKISNLNQVTNYDTGIPEIVTS